MINQTNGSAFSHSLRDLGQDRTSDILFEARLYQLGLIGVLEDAGILPIVKHDNPFDAVTDSREHDRWWREHPEQQQEYIAKTKQRDMVLWALRVGYMLNSH